MKSFQKSPVWIGLTAFVYSENEPKCQKRYKVNYEVCVGRPSNYATQKKLSVFEVIVLFEKINNIVCETMAISFDDIKKNAIKFKT